MPNWCNNYLNITGQGEGAQALLAAFEIMHENEQKQNFQRQQIPGIGMNGWFHDLSVEDGSIRFDTRWGPEREDMKKIALFFKTDFELEYEEPMMGIYGRIIYKDGLFTDVFLDADEIDIIEFDEQGELIPVILCGNTYDYEGDITEFLLDQKIAKMEPTYAFDDN